MRHNARQPSEGAARPYCPLLKCTILMTKTHYIETPSPALLEDCLLWSVIMNSNCFVRRVGGVIFICSLAFFFVPSVVSF